MDWNLTLNSLGEIIGPAVSQGDVVEAAYLAMRLISHRAAVVNRGISLMAFLAREPKASQQSCRLALELVEEIVRRESAALDKIPQDTLDLYTRALSEVVRRRLKQDLQYDEQRGTALLEELRRAG
jgi:hypothetical protein